METEYWVLSIVAILLALVAGFIGGRMSAPRQRRVEAMEQERDTAREEAEAVRAEVNRHFEESARMFGKLASDYRTFFQQFAQTAQNLGLSEGRARELLEEADPSLVARQAGKADSAASSVDAQRAGTVSASASASPAGDESDATPTEVPVGDRTGADETAPSGDTPKQSADTAEASADGAASDRAPSDGDERPGPGGSDEAPQDYEAARDRRG